MDVVKDNKRISNSLFIMFMYILVFRNNNYSTTLILYNIAFYINNIISLLRLTQRASETMASAALALVALRLIMIAAVAIEAMMEIIREQMIRMASGEAPEPDLLQAPVVLS